MSESNSSNSFLNINNWIKIVYIAFFLTISYFLIFLLGAFGLLQAVYLLFTGKTIDRISDFGQSLSNYYQQMTRYITDHNNPAPFPFSDWPKTGSSVGKKPTKHNQPKSEEKAESNSAEKSAEKSDEKPETTEKPVKLKTVVLDEEGKVVKKRGRPKIHPDKPKLVDKDGNPIQRKRGRPKKDAEVFVVKDGEPTNTVAAEDKSETQAEIKTDNIEETKS